MVDAAVLAAACAPALAAFVFHQFESAVFTPKVKAQQQGGNNKTDFNFFFHRYSF